MNVVTLSGVLQRDPDLQFHDGRPQTRLDIRCAKLVQGRDGRWKRGSIVVPVYLFGEKAERVAGWNKEGSVVEVVGRIEVYENAPASNGAPICAVVADRVDPVKA